MNPVISELRGIYEHAMTHDPRSLQKRIGPSELGTPCDRCLIHKLAGTPTVDDSTPWLPTIGRAVHEWAELALVQHLAATGGDDWLAEAIVNVGQVDGQDITGTADVFHVPTGTVVDLKIVGATTLKKVGVSGDGCSEVYRAQVDLYGLGFERLGYRVEQVAVWFLPRNAMSLASARLYTATWNKQRALDALERANRFASWIRLFGAEQVLAGCPHHTGHEFSCSRYADVAQVATSAHSPADFLGVA